MPKQNFVHANTKMLPNRNRHQVRLMHTPIHSHKRLQTYLMFAKLALTPNSRTRRWERKRLITLPLMRAWLVFSRVRILSGWYLTFGTWWSCRRILLSMSKATRYRFFWRFLYNTGHSDIFHMNYLLWNFQDGLASKWNFPRFDLYSLGIACIVSVDTLIVIWGLVFSIHGYIYICGVEQNGDPNVTLAKIESNVGLRRGLQRFAATAALNGYVRGCLFRTFANRSHAIQTNFERMSLLTLYVYLVASLIQAHSIFFSDY